MGNSGPTVVLDASAILAFLGDESGREAVGHELTTAGCLMSTANWSEVVQKAHQHSLPMSALAAIAELVDLRPVERRHAEQAALLWHQGSGLSLADRLCLALAIDEDVPAMTADRAWSHVGLVDVTVIR